MSTYSLERVCAIHDLSGFGRASLTVAIPILSTMGFQVCPLPTAVLSSQTSGVSDFSFCDLTSEMPRFLAHWLKLKLKFASTYSGFLGNPSQVEHAAFCIHNLLADSGLAFVDPVLGDNGLLDPTQTTEMVEAQRYLVHQADIIAPNLTEAAFLLKANYEQNLPLNILKDELQALANMGPKIVIITSAPANDQNLCAVIGYDKVAKKFYRLQNKHYPVFYPGTGDTFSSCLVGCFLQKDDLPTALKRAIEFVSYGIEITYAANTPQVEGVLLEKTLHLLHKHPIDILVDEI